VKKFKYNNKKTFSFTNEIFYSILFGEILACKNILFLKEFMVAFMLIYITNTFFFAIT